MPTDIDRAVRARICAPDHADRRELTAILSYHRSDPLAVYISFPPSVTLGGTEVTWVFARDLLADGLRCPSGDGDVHLWPSGRDETMLELRAPDGVVLLELAAAEVRQFLCRSYEAVPANHEDRLLNIDAGLSMLLAHESD